MKKTLFALIIIMIFAFFTFAGTTDDHAVNVVNHPGCLEYNGSFTITAAAVDTVVGAIHYTQWFDISSVKDELMLANFVATEVGTEDVNVFIEYSNRHAGITDTVIATTNSALDSVGVLSVQDTINVIGGVTQIKHRSHKWMRYKFVLGQANNDGMVFKHHTYITKPEGLKNTHLGKVADAT